MQFFPPSFFFFLFLFLSIPIIYKRTPNLLPPTTKKKKKKKNLYYITVTVVPLVNLPCSFPFPSFYKLLGKLFLSFFPTRQAHCEQRPHPSPLSLIFSSLSVSVLFFGPFLFAGNQGGLLSFMGIFFIFFLFLTYLIPLKFLKLKLAVIIKKKRERERAIF